MISRIPRNRPDSLLEIRSRFDSWKFAGRQAADSSSSTPVAATLHPARFNEPCQSVAQHAAPFPRTLVQHCRDSFIFFFFFISSSSFLSSAFSSS